MQPGSADAPAPHARPRTPRRERAVADAVGRSVLVFVFVPVLAGLPSWIRYELANPLNFTDPVGNGCSSAPAPPRGC
jgi:hypothetical protein